MERLGGQLGAWPWSSWDVEKRASLRPFAWIPAPLQSTPKSGARAGYDGAKQRKGSNVHIAVELAYVDQGYTGSNAAGPHNVMAYG